MTDEQWQKLLKVISGENVTPIPAGFIIDSPWLPEWAGITKLDYFCNDQMWFQANLQAVQKFPQAIMLPGFWSEYGMCTEPSAFGAKCVWHEHELPWAAKIFDDIQAVDNLQKPNPETDGLAPFVIQRLKHYQKDIEKAGHAIRFAVVRGPLNVASFLMGPTEFLIALKTDPQRAHKLLRIITDYLKDFLLLQKKTFDSIDGIFMLDDIVGFCGKQDFQEFALGYFKEIFSCFDASVRFFHNDANGQASADLLAEAGVNLFNFSFSHSLADMKQWTGGGITLLGNIPPRDVLAAGTPAEVKQSVKDALQDLKDTRRIILSCGGGMSPDTPTENIDAFIEAVNEIS